MAISTAAVAYFVASSRSATARAMSSARATWWRMQRGCAASRSAIAAGRSPWARWTRALLTPLQNESSTRSAQRRAASRSPSATASTVPHRVSQPRTSAPNDSSSTSVLCLGEDTPGGLEVTFVDVCLGELGHGQDATEEHRLGWCVGESGEFGQCPGTIAELPMRQRLGNGQLGAHDGHVCDLGDATNAGGHAEGVQRPAGQRLTHRAGSFERQATLRIATQGDLGLADFVGRVVPPLRQRHFACDSVGGEPAERVLPAGLPEIGQHLSTQRAALDPATTDDRRRSPQHVHASADGVVRVRLVGPPRQLLDELDEPTPIDQEMAPRVVDHRFEIADSDGRRYRRQSPLDRGLTAAVVEAAVVGREKSEHVSRSIGQVPLIERHDHLAGVLEPTRRRGCATRPIDSVIDWPGRR